MLSLRPERVRIDAREDQFDNVFDGTVKELIYLGDHIRVRVHLCGNDEFIVKVPNASGERRVRVGEVLRLGWASRDCRALDPS
jgi:putative spermidine/putrescine transport system ATP-binding protein